MGMTMECQCSAFPCHKHGTELVGCSVQQHQGTAAPTETPGNRAQLRGLNSPVTPATRQTQKPRFSFLFYPSTEGFRFMCQKRAQALVPGQCQCDWSQIPTTEREQTSRFPTPFCPALCMKEKKENFWCFYLHIYFFPGLVHSLLPMFPMHFFDNFC